MDEKRAVVCTLRRAAEVPFGDLTFVVTRFLPHLNRDGIWRILEAEGLNRRRPPVSDRPARDPGGFRDGGLGFIRIDTKRLPKLQTTDGERRKRCLFVAVGRGSRSMRLAVKDDEAEASAIALLRQAEAAYPFQLTHMLTDNGRGPRARLPAPAPGSERNAATPRRARLIAEAAKVVSQPDTSFRGLACRHDAKNDAFSKAPEQAFVA